MRMAANAIFSFSHIPLRVASILGTITLCLGLFYAAYILLAWCFGGTIERGWTGMMMAVLILGGVQLLCLGIIAEYLGRVPRPVLPFDYAVTQSAALAGGSLIHETDVPTLGRSSDAPAHS